jgi:diguanylate cyclase (GGDEF)-like protein/PAS domain S-box-containing protein
MKKSKQKKISTRKESLTIEDSEQNQNLLNILQKRIADRTKKLEESLSLVRATLESTADGILMVSNEGKLIDWNQKFIKLLRIPQHVIEGGVESKGLEYVLSQIENPQALVDLMQNVSRNPELQGDVGEIHFKDGRIFERYSQPHRLDNRIVGRVWSFRDITERRKAEEALRLRERAIEASTHGVIIANAESPYCIIYVNPAFERITGYKKNETLGKKFDFLYGDQEEKAEIIKIRLALKEKREVNAVLQSYQKNKSVIWSELHIAPVPNTAGIISNFIGIMVDITLRKKMEEQLIHQATHDKLTDLPNRSLFRDRLEQAILYSNRSSSIIAILFLDLDRFKLINDGLGHNIGDELLKIVGERLLTCVRKTDTVARVGGDEFIIISPGHKNSEDAIPFAQKILNNLSTKFFLHETEINISTSIGISLFPIDGQDIDTLMKNADIAMYQAKELGRDNFQFYTAEMNQRLTERLNLEHDLHLAIENNEFTLFYQPLICLHTERIIGLEALIRWAHPIKGLIAPSNFISVAEESGLILPIGEWVLKTACKQAKSWQQAGLPTLQMAVNISGRQLKSATFCKYVQQIIKDIDLDPCYLELELTESMLMENTALTSTILKDLNEFGIKFIIDDFGIGYSSLSYFGRLPVHKIKIDRSFINGITVPATNATAIIQTIIAMGKNLNLKVLAEGVETKEQLKFLRQTQCDEAQGFYFYKPLDAKRCTEVLKKLKPT